MGAAVFRHAVFEYGEQGRGDDTSRRRPEALLGDKGYDSIPNPNRDELRERRILSVISGKGAPNIQGMGKLRYVVEQTFALLHLFKRVAVRWERRTELHDAFVSLACSPSLETAQEAPIVIVLRACRACKPGLGPEMPRTAGQRWDGGGRYRE
ncbi:hypothetical protein ACIQ9Q_40790 [Streptomyces sp. NPDC094438]|uniref:hypothetical protein n=1 Tax=Streptomyces sp. NPDC094438 TaxID=3366061 RepID=UPI003825FC76